MIPRYKYRIYKYKYKFVFEQVSSVLSSCSALDKKFLFCVGACKPVYIHFQRALGPKYIF